MIVMTNAFEKQSHLAPPIWDQPSVPVAVDNRPVLHVVSAPDHDSGGVLLIDSSPTIRAGSMNPPVGGLLKRILDLIIAVTALVMAAPVMIAVALLIRTTTGGSAVFPHSRIGFGGRPFNCYKFRSMVGNSEAVLKACLESNPDIKMEWEKTHKIRNDPRVTFLGRMLRRSSLDELPQLYNIIRGDMSCVGPRPVVKEELELYGDHVGDYLRARPGLTGLWQVSGRSSVDYATRVALDSQYVRNWSVWSDIVILFRTVFAVMRFDRTS
ncbi:sugar transferase [Mesorhizobium sp. ES1-3]|uniref:sugar transferase n=1 Tax=Mesorhizobium sp. ES1-3 TaxID=2876628 RepID=UPI0029620202|nr:sugar transferase [Mesorhizobium sp. ES1-3]